MKKISIIIPVYNGEIYIRRCLDSILEQSYPVYEIIVIDDCSHDNTLQMLKEYEKRDERIKVLINEKNVGQGVSRNIGLSNATGEYVLFIDVDDYVKLDYVEQLISHMTSDYDVVVSGYILKSGKKEKKRRIVDTPWAFCFYAGPWGKLYNRDFLVREGIDFGTFHPSEDIYFSIMTILRGIRYKIIPYEGYCYILHEGSTTCNNEYVELAARELIRIIEKCLNQNMNMSEEQKNLLAYIYIVNIINILGKHGYRCSKSQLRKIHKMLFDDIKQKFPLYRKNPYICCFRNGFYGVRVITHIFMMLHKCRMDLPVLYLISVFIH